MAEPQTNEETIESTVGAPTDEFEIEVVDDTPEQDKGRKPLEKPVEEPTDDEIENYSEGVKKRIKELTHARHDERRAKEALAREREELERFARHLVEENKRLKQTVTTGSAQVAESAKSAASAELEVARKKYKEAYEAGDPDRVLEAQEALTEAKLKLQAAASFRPPVQEREEALQQPEPVVQRQQPSPPPLDEKTLRWQAKNQWFGSPGYEEITSFSLGLHQKLVNSGVDPRSDEYFEQIDSRLRSKFPEVFKDTSAAPSDSSRKPPTVVASASRTTGAKKVQLTATQLALAKKYGLTPQQYAAEVIKLERSNG
jgi:hypothetical protein